MNIFLDWDCPLCGTSENSAEITITSGPMPGKLSGPPEDCYPSESAEWELESATCVACGHAPDAEWFAGKYEDTIQEKAAWAVEDDGPEDEDFGGNDGDPR